MADSNPVNDISLQNPIPNPIPPEKPSSTLSQQSPPPPGEPESMPLPPSTAPVYMPPPPASVPPPSPPPPVPAAVPSPPTSKKRPLEGSALLQDCCYFKIRAVIRDMRPHLLAVIRTVDFRNCEGADELRERLKLLKQLCEQMTAEAVTMTKCKSASEGQKLPGENGTAQKPEQLQAAKNAYDVKEAIDLEEQSSYIGGSAFGWNFVTFASNKAIYYGRTKESYRAAQAALASASTS